MKKIFSAGIFRLLFLVLPATAGLLTAACTKDPEPVVAQDYSGIDDAIIKKSLADSTITTAQKQPSGLYYVPKVTNPNAVLATAGKTVYVNYTGKFIDGRVFDKSTTPIRFVLGRKNVIDGWDIGIALMHVGDKARLYIPSVLAYGPSGRPAIPPYISIPPYTVLYFDVELTAVL